MNEFPRGVPEQNTNSRTENHPTSPGENDIPLKSYGDKRILVIEDDELLSSFVVEELGTHQFSVHAAYDGEAAVSMLGEGAAYDLIILDLNLPKINGLDVLRQLRRMQSRPRVLVLTAEARVQSKVKALQDGADDYLTKPFSPSEFIARVHALLRRDTEIVPDRSQIADLILDRVERRVERNGRRIDLTPREFTILEFMMRNTGRPVSRATLLQEVWDLPPDQPTNIVDVYMKYVRDKVDGPGEVKLTHTIRGVGYQLRGA